MFDVITIGGATRDIIFVTDKGKIISTPQNLTEQKLLAFEYGAKIKSDQVYFSSGGGACNVAVSLSRLGLKSAAVLRIGKDQNGTEIKNNLLKEKVDTKFIQEDKKIGTSVSFIVIAKEKGDRVIFNWQGANKKLNLPAVATALQAGIKNEKLKTTIKNSKWLYSTSLSGQWRENLKEITSIVKENKIKLAFNPGATQIKSGRKKLAKTLKSTEILFLNRDEAIELVLSCPPKPSAQADGRQAEKKLKRKNFNDPVNLIKIIREWGPKIIVVTQGLFGAWVGDQKNIYHAPAISKKRIDTTGAGDAFGSGFLGGFILSNENVQTALKYAIINSGNVVGYYGAQEGLLTREKVKSRLNKIKIEKNNILDG